MPDHLDLGEPTVNEQFDAGFEAAVIRSEEDGSLRNLIRQSQSPERNRRSYALQSILSLLSGAEQLTQAFGVDRAGVSPWSLPDTSFQILQMK